MSCADLMNLEPQVALEPRKEGACLRVLVCSNAGNVLLRTVYGLHLPSATGRLPSLVADHLVFKIK